MATTLEILTILQEQYKGWNINGTRGILHYLNLAHRLFRQQEAEQTIYFTPATGRLPYQNTVAGTYQYTLPTNCWKLFGVFVEAGVTGSLLDSYYGTGYAMRVAAPKKIEVTTLSGIDYLRIHNVRSSPWSESGNATVLFTDDPGTTTDIYNIGYYRLPVDLVSDSIQMEVEPPWDEMYLLPATCKLIEGVEHGNYAEARKEVIDLWKSSYWKELNTGEQGMYSETEDRGY